MDIYDIINNAAYIAKCNSTEENKYIRILDKNEFLDVYEEIKLRNTFLIIDKKGNINFFIKLKDPFLIKDLTENNKIYLFADWSCYGPEIILDIKGMERIPGFILELDKNLDVFILQKFLKNKEAFIQFIVQDEQGIIKLLTEKTIIDEGFVERLKYFIELDFYGAYPIITESEELDEEGYYIKTNSDINVLEEILNITGGLSRQIANESVVVHVKADDFYTIIFLGDTTNIGAIFDEVSKKINIVEEGRAMVTGKPFFQYKNGLLYFLNNSNTLNTGGNKE